MRCAIYQPEFGKYPASKFTTSAFIHDDRDAFKADEFKIRLNQVENTVKLMTEVVKRLNKETVHKITFE